VDYKNVFEHISTILIRVLSEPASYIPNLPIGPFDSPIEDLFASACFAHLDAKVTIEPQCEVSSKHGLFFIDFVLMNENKRIGVECDGKDYHHFLRDELRDAILLGEGHLTTIYHFRGCDLVYHPGDCAWLMSLLDRNMFSERGKLHLAKLRTLETDKLLGDLVRSESLRFDIAEEEHTFWALRRSTQAATCFENEPYYWKRLYQFANQYPSTSLDVLLETLDLSRVNATASRQATRT